MGSSPGKFIYLYKDVFLSLHHRFDSGEIEVCLPRRMISLRRLEEISETTGKKKIIDQEGREVIDDPLGSPRGGILNRV